jgi:arginyl-tRNA synthetase
MSNIRKAITDAVLDALADKTAIDRDGLESSMTAPPKPEMGDVAVPCFPLAKALRNAPQRIAEELAGKIDGGGLIERVEAMGPYLNVFMRSSAVLEDLVRGLADDSFEASARTADPARVMIEFSQPNTHKVFHVGHLRNVAVGDALQRVFRARGHDVVAANYYGDFGIDVAKCLWWLQHEQTGAPPDEGRCAWLGQAYVAMTAELERLKEDEPDAFAARMAELKAILEGIQSGDPELTELYQRTRQWCLDEFASIYGWLGVDFDTDFFESELEEEGQRIVDEYIEKGVFVPSQGAIICDLEPEKLGAALVRKTDGTSLYLTWDLVLARRKFDDFGIERSLYVVGSEQTYHFQQLFATLGRMGYERAADCRHVSYELVMLPTGKMSSRKGTAIPFHELVRELRGAIEEKMRGDERSDRSAWSAEQWEETVQRVAVACLRFGMLRATNTTRVVFDLDAWTSLEGETGAYLLYSLARISGIHRKGGRPDPAELLERIAAADEFGAPAERALLNHVLGYPAVLAQVERTCDPSQLATWLFEGARAFSRFYHDHPVLKAEEPLRSARLGLVHATEAVLGAGLRTLGIEPVEEM